MLPDGSRARSPRSRGHGDSANIMNPAVCDAAGRAKENLSIMCLPEKLSIHSAKSLPADLMNVSP
eukprot:7763619-Pyramimonas_sp.AAC.1